MNTTIYRLAAIFTAMVENNETYDEIWKNIRFGKEAFAMMQSLPDTLPGEYESPAEKAGLLCQMLDQMDETMSPRFCISVREEIARLDPENSDNLGELTKLRDYIDPKLPMPEFCKRYNRHLKFDPVERTAEYEAIIADVESELAEELKDEPRGMVYCFGYWSAKSAALARRGIRWKSPALMNPGVMFD